MSPGLTRDDTRGLANETYFSNSIVSLKQYLSGIYKLGGLPVNAWVLALEVQNHEEWNNLLSFVTIAQDGMLSNIH